jgi:hypothetical protein
MRSPEQTSQALRRAYMQPEEYPEDEISLVKAVFSGLYSPEDDPTRQEPYALVAYAHDEKHAVDTVWISFLFIMLQKGLSVPGVRIRGDT